MDTEEYSLRKGIIEDSFKLARLYRIGSAGLMDAVYGGSEPGLSTSEIIARRIADPQSIFGFNSFTVATVRNNVVGQCCAFSETKLDTDRLYRYLTSDRRNILEIINSINYPGSLYISALTVGKRFRGTGIVRSLLLNAEERAQQQNLDSVSIHGFGDNNAAISMYCRMGYKIYDSKQLPHDPALVYSGPILLLAKDLD